MNNAEASTQPDMDKLVRSASDATLDRAIKLLREPEPEPDGAANAVRDSAPALDLDRTAFRALVALNEASDAVTRLGSVASLLDRLGQADEDGADEDGCPGDVLALVADVLRDRLATLAGCLSEARELVRAVAPQRALAAG